VLPSADQVHRQGEVEEPYLMHTVKHFLKLLEEI
jgi:hypothetical protein